MLASRLLLLVAVVVGLVACGDDVSHENIDKWMRTQGGPGKLRGALLDRGVDPDLSAHAAENLVLIREDGTVRDAIAKLDTERRAKVIEKLVPRLWKLARIEGEMSGASDQQIAAKDMMYELRDYSTGATQTQLDDYLIEWFTGGWFEARASTGRWSGPQVMRAIGARAGAGMVRAANQVLTTKPTAQNASIRIGDNLLLGLAVTGDPEAIGYVLKFVEDDRKDKSLPERAVSALYQAFVEPPSALFTPADPAGLSQHVPAIANITTDPDSTNRMINDAIRLLGTAGMPHCLPPLINMINHPSNDERFMWVGIDNALRCGGVEAVDDVAAALPVAGMFEHEAFAGTMVSAVTQMPREGAQQAARALLRHKSWVARWAGVEILSKIGVAEDAAAVAALEKDRTVVSGYWGDQSEVPAKERKKEPTVGERARAVATQLRGS